MARCQQAPSKVWVGVLLPVLTSALLEYLVLTPLKDIWLLGNQSMWQHCLNRQLRSIGESNATLA